MKRTSSLLALGGLLSLACAGGSAPTSAPPASPAPTTQAPTSQAPTSTAPAAPAVAPPITPLPGPDSGAPIPYFATPIPVSAVSHRSLRELTLMRNTIYARAGNPFRKRWLNAYFSAQPWYRPQATLDSSALSTVDVANAQTIAAYEAAIKQSELLSRIDNVANRLVATQDTAPREQVETDLIELMLLDRATGQVFPDDERVKVPDWFKALVDVTPLDDPSRLDQLLTVDELRDFSRRDLRILRNMVYARRGRPFQSQLLSEYFSRMEWYHPIEGWTEAKLTDVDQRNVKLIRSVEDSIGGPLTDLQQQASDEWFSGA